MVHNTLYCRKLHQHESMFLRQLDCYICSCHEAWCRGRTRMQILQKNLIYYGTNKRQDQKARLSRITKNLTVNMKNLQNKTWLELWKQNYDSGQWLWARTINDQPDNMNGGEDLAKNWGNLETKILWAGDWWWGAAVKQKQVTWVKLSDRGKNMTRNKPENKTRQK